MNCMIFGSFKNPSFPRLQRQFKVFNIFWKTDLTYILICKTTIFSNGKLFGKTSQFHCFHVKRFLWKCKPLNTANIKRKREKKQCLCPTLAPKGDHLKNRGQCLLIRESPLVYQSFLQSQHPFRLNAEWIVIIRPQLRKIIKRKVQKKTEAMLSIWKLTVSPKAHQISVVVQ